MPSTPDPVNVIPHTPEPEKPAPNTPVPTFGSELLGGVMLPPNTPVFPTALTPMPPIEAASTAVVSAANTFIAGWLRLIVEASTAIPNSVSA